MSTDDLTKPASADSSTSARAAAEEIANGYYFCDENTRANWKGREQEVYEDITAIIERHYEGAR